MLNTKKIYHEPVLVKEVCDGLQIDKLALLNHQATIVDATVGFGGHSFWFVKKGLFVLGIDVDEFAISECEKTLAKACPSRQHSLTGCFKLVNSNFRNIKEIVKANSITNIYGVLMDLGVSSYQLTSGLRGFSFLARDADLDMRMDKNLAVKASDVLNFFSKKELVNLFSVCVNYNYSLRIAESVISFRKTKNFATVGDFLDVLESVGLVSGKINPATLPFLALRIFVNSELSVLENSLPDAFSVLEKGGRLAVISFHSGEDRIVKNFFNNVQKRKEGVIVNKKPILPSIEEIRLNPRARSAKLRLIEKI
ncbi:MAG: 16S rRNA (cytosine(1402)-N(4))-methyltransferase RsmH [Patescibacteria group bacterium]|nr:16S rRNA (cytosine(1402)-N(4))-methyltransferase RsmH [Patescibacteria group bacterium]